MKVHIVTEDKFFSLGLSSSASDFGFSYCHMSTSEFETILDEHQYSSDIYVIHIASSDMNLAMLLSREWLPNKFIALVPDNYMKYIDKSIKNQFLFDSCCDTDDILFAVNKIAFKKDSYPPPKVSLTDMEKKILRQIFNGYSIENISQRNGIALKTVYTHRLNAMRKLAIRTSHDFSLAKESIKYLWEESEYSIREHRA
ncbi:helix-turn-helix domain-containing protein [Serratia proteamaculans]|uniref:helix-turn-helix domain-containing protein n=1 Tax=Serratia proteamaculans TaxID=28151 RepID=UPI001577401A|nr:LuxR C-terminal-related transcriptional regulator [Serratia proteamaculans]